MCCIFGHKAVNWRKKKGSHLGKKKSISLIYGDIQYHIFIKGLLNLALELEMD